MTCTWDRASRTDRFRIRAEALEDLTFPVSVSLERVEEKWTRNEYVFMPAAVYNGNRMESRKIPYPPYCGEKTETGWREVITDIPHLSKDGENRDIQFLSGDMSTPAFGYYSQEDRTGVLLLAKHEENGRYTGFTMREKGEKEVFGISAPGVREGKHYEKVDDNTIKTLSDSGYSHGMSWALGNVFNTYVLEGQPADVWEQTKELNDSAKTSPLLGFSFDPDPVATEITNISTVVKQYESLVGGELRVEETNAEFVEQLKVAGVDTVIEEMQKQVDEFMASK